MSHARRGERERESERAREREKRGELARAVTADTRREDASTSPYPNFSIPHLCNIPFSCSRSPYCAHKPFLPPHARMHRTSLQVPVTAPDLAISRTFAARAPPMPLPPVSRQLCHVPVAQPLHYRCRHQVFIPRLHVVGFRQRRDFRHIIVPPHTFPLLARARRRRTVPPGAMHSR